MSNLGLSSLLVKFFSGDFVNKNRFSNKRSVVGDLKKNVYDSEDNFIVPKNGILTLVNKEDQTFKLI